MDLCVRNARILKHILLKPGRYFSANGVIIRHPLPQTRSFTKLGHHFKNGSEQFTLLALTSENVQR